MWIKNANDDLVGFLASKCTPVTYTSGSFLVTEDNSAGIFVGSDGNIVGQLEQDTEDRTFAVKGGIPYPFKFKSINETGTTAGGLLILF